MIFIIIARSEFTVHHTQREICGGGGGGEEIMFYKERGVGVEGVF